MRTVMRGRRSRQGFTLVLMMLLLTVFIGAAAFATDFGKMYLIRGQLQTAADAGALAGMFWNAMGGTPKIAAVDSARSLTRRHKVGTALYDSSTADVAPGNWKDTTACSPGPSPCFIGNGNDWTDPKVDAVRVIVHFTGTYNFGRYFGFNTRALYDTAVAIRGNSSSSTCVRPWAIPYQALLDVLDPTLTVTYNLTTDDITWLRNQTTANAIQLKVGSSGGFSPHGEFYAAKLPPALYADGTVGTPWNGGNDYGDGLQDTCGQLEAAMIATGSPRGATISVGDFLQPETGNKVGPTRSAINALCGSDVCSPPYKVAAALWDTVKTANPCNGCYHVKYIGSFAITGWDQGNNAVLGFFSSMATPGGGPIPVGGGTPGPSQKIGLRK